MNKLSQEFKAEMAKRIIAVTDGIVLRDHVHTAVDNFVKANHGMKMVQFKNELARECARLFIGFFNYLDFDIDVNNLKDEILDSLRGLGAEYVGID
jgi:hypothetical protein